MTREYFQLLADREPPKSSLLASVGIHGVIFTFLILLPLIAPQTMRLNYRTTLLAPPPEKPEIRQPVQVKLTPVPRPQPKIEPQPVVRLPEPVIDPVPAPPPPKPVVRQPEVRITENLTKPVAPTSTTSLPRIEPKAAPNLTAPSQPPVVTNVFSTSTPAAAPVVPTRNTEVAGFGEAAANHDNNRAAKAGSTATGGFGDANGSPSGSARGRTGATETVGAFGGFDGGVPGGRGSSAGGRGTVMMAGFVASADVPKAAQAQKMPDPGKIEKPVEILLKPRPDYTDEARKQRVEGEVLLRVLFTAAGEVRVLEVTRGLGHGLNENAVRAAESIRFKPAQQAGQAVDSTAIVHIVFQLAY
jgi:TonB family protein